MKKREERQNRYKDNPKRVNLYLGERTRKQLTDNKNHSGEAYNRYVERAVDHMGNRLFMNTVEVAPGVFGLLMVEPGIVSGVATTMF